MIARIVYMVLYSSSNEQTRRHIEHPLRAQTPITRFFKPKRRIMISLQQLRSSYHPNLAERFFAHTINNYLLARLGKPTKAFSHLTSSSELRQA
jgi:hypothetical protein